MYLISAKVFRSLSLSCEISEISKRMTSSISPTSVRLSSLALGSAIMVVTRSSWLENSCSILLILTSSSFFLSGSIVIVTLERLKENCFLVSLCWSF